MKQKSWLGIGVAAIIAAGALTFAACGDDDDDDEDESVLEPGGSNVSGNLSTVNTNGDITLGGIVVVVRGDRDTQGTTDALGNFLVTNASTGNITVLFRRGACEAGFPLENVNSRSQMTLTNISFLCTSAAPSAIGESIEAVLRDDPGSNPATLLNTCVRVGDDDQRRDVDASSAAIFDGGSSASFEAFDGDDHLEISGSRSGTGPAGVLDASTVRILQRDVNDPCDDDPLG